MSVFCAWTLFEYETKYIKKQTHKLESKEFKPIHFFIVNGTTIFVADSVNSKRGQIFPAIVSLFFVVIFLNEQNETIKCWLDKAQKKENCSRTNWRTSRELSRDRERKTKLSVEWTQFTTQCFLLLFLFQQISIVGVSEILVEGCVTLKTLLIFGL